MCDAHVTQPNLLCSSPGFDRRILPVLVGSYPAPTSSTGANSPSPCHRPSICHSVAGLVCVCVCVGLRATRSISYSNFLLVFPPIYFPASHFILANLDTPSASRFAAGIAELNFSWHSASLSMNCSCLLYNKSLAWTTIKHSLCTCLHYEQGFLHDWARQESSRASSSVIFFAACHSGAVNSRLVFLYQTGLSKRVFWLVILSAVSLYSRYAQGERSRRSEHRGLSQYAVQRSRFFPAMSFKTSSLI